MGAPETAVIGLGNVVLSDDGLGVHAVARMRSSYSFGDSIELVEGGTAGLLLLPWIADARRVIIADAIDRRTAPGTLVRLDGEDWAAAFAPPISPHDVGLRDLLGAARLSGCWPLQLVLLGLQPATTAIGTELSAPVSAALDGLVDAILAQLEVWHGPAVHRTSCVGPGPAEQVRCA